MSDYTPTTDEMRFAWAERVNKHDEEGANEFDRWLAGHDWLVHNQALMTVRNTLVASNAVTVAGSGGALEIIDKMRGVSDD